LVEVVVWGLDTGEDTGFEGVFEEGLGLAVGIG